jgi:hypothetical protein
MLRQRIIHHPIQEMEMENKKTWWDHILSFFYFPVRMCTRKNKMYENELEYV